MRYAEGPSIECHHIPIEQARQPVPVFGKSASSAFVTAVATRYGRPRSADERQKSPLIGTQLMAVSFEPQSIG
jgi:hypothetical protein